MPDHLSAERVTTELAGLDGWTGDTTRIRRSVDAGSRSAEIIEAVAVTAAELNHHPVVASEAGTVTFEVWTHSAGAVTGLDIELARRIDAVLHGLLDLNR
ncbi:MAG TPA: 4a-hydroxytetrahydrobiopterin dehydratase [Mycobacteriales bacterium]|nr:4a-hydroxytetrahydrobiopterin dehydratase [Mycobacteriales bacterium]